MNPQKYCISLDLARRLHELGVKKESMFYWYRRGTFGNYNTTWVLGYKKEVNIKGDPDWLKNCGLPAYTSGELGEMLKAQQICISASIKILPLWNGGEWVLFKDGKLLLRAGSEADARAKMLIYLLENGLLKTLDK